MNKIGEILRSTREKRNLTLSQAAGKIKVREEYLEKIENDEILGNDVFTIGYIRLYSKYLRVNIEEMISDLKSGVSEAVEESVEEIVGRPSDKEPFSFNKKKVFFIVSITVIFIISAFVLLNRDVVAPDTEKNNLSSRDIAKEAVKPKEEKIVDSKISENNHAITKLSDSQFDVKDISQESNSLRVVALDSTMVTFLDDSGNIIKEVFVKIGESISLPVGYKNMLIKTRIPLSIKIEDIKSVGSGS